VRPPTAAQPQLVAPGETVIRVFPAAMAKFLVVRGLNTNVEYPIYEGPNFIGRFDENPVDIDLTPQEAEDNPWASRQHACVSYENGGLFIEDLGSVNGTFVNKNKITKGEKVALKNGDYVQTGTVMFKVKY
jgi:pSer/pThr/pTyr-binding forkhead associated (FHA) protein